ncbi:unnamed protein product [Closterium sp. Yama58-4]|nr:unnamed protein product [Closterium sp. Yama58-4]
MARPGGVRVSSPLLLLFLATLLPLLAAPVTAIFFPAPTFPDFSFDALRNLVAGKKLPDGQLRAKSSPRVNSLAQSCGYFSDAPYFSNGLTALLPSNLYKKGKTCGACYAVECAGGDRCKKNNATVTVRVVGSVGWFTLHRGLVLSTQAWDRIASSRDGRAVQVKVKRTNCKSPSGLFVRVRTASNKNRFRLQLLGTKGPGAVRLVEVSVDGSKWTALTREGRTTTWQLLRHKDIARAGKPISVRVTAAKTGQKIVLDKIIPAKWTPSNTYGPGLTNFNKMPLNAESPKPPKVNRTGAVATTKRAPAAKTAQEEQSQGLKEPSASNTPVQSEPSAAGPRVALQDDATEGEELEWGEGEEQRGGRSLAEEEEGEVDLAEEMEDGWALGDEGWGDDEAQGEADDEERAEGRSLAEEGAEEGEDESAAEEVQREEGEEEGEEEVRMLAEESMSDGREEGGDGEESEESEEGRLLAEGEEDEGMEEIEEAEEEIDSEKGRVLVEGGDVEEEEEVIELPRELAADNDNQGKEKKTEEKKEEKKPGVLKRTANAIKDFFKNLGERITGKQNKPADNGPRKVGPMEAKDD